jgi:cytoskeletal protein CcmA (bactofilin family)
MATYVNDLRLKEIGTGESSGTWGSETNTNLELIAEAFSFGTEAITTNADTHTTTIADGSTDPGRSIFLKYTGTLDSACTITIGPNTVSKMWFIENGTSGSQNIIISQGSGANITIPPGDVKAVYSDGAGSGAAIVDAFASLNVVDLKVEDDLTVTDDTTIGGTLGVTGVLTATSLDISGDIDVDGTSNLDIVDIDGAVNIAAATTIATDNKIQFRDTAIHISSSADGQLDLVADTEIQIAATTIDIDGAINASGEIIAASLDISGDVDIDGTLETDALSIASTTITATAAELNFSDGVTSNIQTQLDTKTSTGKAIAMAIVFG